MALKALAIMSTYNEEDIIYESLEKLINQGINVYMIDNGSNDQTIHIANNFLNKGLIKIESCLFKENGAEVYDWTSILKRKEEIAIDLNYDWFLHVDADEIRYSPWNHLNLREGIEMVDQMGFNLINFRLFNFRLTHEVPIGSSFENCLTYYSEVEQFNRMQVKAWKKSTCIDLVSHGGHLALVPNAKIFPIRFIHKHYPIRSIEQGIKKIIHERLGRYSQADLRKGWHVQYDHLNINNEKLKQELIWDCKKLKEFNLNEITQELLLDATKLLAYLAQSNKIEKFQIDIQTINKILPNSENISNEVKIDLIETTHELRQQLKKGEVINLDISPDSSEAVYIIYSLLESQAIAEYMRGDPALFENLKNLNLK